MMSITKAAATAAIIPAVEAMFRDAAGLRTDRLSAGTIQRFASK